MVVTIGTSTWPVKIWDAAGEFIWYIKPLNIPEVWQNKPLVSEVLPDGNVIIISAGSIDIGRTLTECSMPPDTAADGNWAKLSRAFRYWSENSSTLSYDEYVGSADFDVGTWSNALYTAVEDITITVLEVRITSKTYEEWTFSVVLKRAT